MLDSLDGRKYVYSGWEELHKTLPKLLSGSKTIAMQYSPENNIPYIGLVDAGTVELVRKLKKKVVSSANLVQKFEATWSNAQLESHLDAGKIIDRIRQDAFLRAAAFVREGKPLTEYDLQQWIARAIPRQWPSARSDDRRRAAEQRQPALRAESGRLAPDSRRRFAAARHVGEIRPRPAACTTTSPGSATSETACPTPTRKYFGIVSKARDNAVEFVQEAVAEGRSIHGWEVDRAARETIRKAGYAKYFVHRTGHSIGENIHGNGANMDSLETRDDRKIIPHTCFSIEPGIYLPEFGIRSEVNVYVGEHEARVTGAIQEEILPLLA